MSFVDEFKSNSSLTYTENGGRAYSTTGSAVLDLFSRIGGLRYEDESEILSLYRNALREDETLTNNMILYARDIRNGGLGERRVAQILLKEMSMLFPEKIKRNFDTIVNAGRWDDLFIFEDTPIEKDAYDFIMKQLRQDVVDTACGKPISLLAKWMPSINASSLSTRRRARKFLSYYYLSEKSYRLTLSILRRYLKVVERQMSDNKFDEISYDTVPSLAMTRYRSAFSRHDPEGFHDYLSEVQSGKKKINTATLYPYDLVKPIIRKNTSELDVLEQQWAALPNYVQGQHNVIVMADVSGSMTVNNYQPLATSVSLGIYFAERNQGDYRNLIMTFSSTPNLYTLSPSMPLVDKVQEVLQHGGYSTNLDAAMKKIYRLSVKAEESPSALVIISDCEIDHYKKQSMTPFVDKWENRFRCLHLKMPKIIFWNVESRGNHYLATKTNPNVSFISGSSAATFRELTTLISSNAMDAMTLILNKPQFSWK